MKERLHYWVRSIEKETQEAEQGTEVDSSLNPEMNDSTVETDEKSDFNMTAKSKITITVRRVRTARTVKAVPWKK